METRLAREMLPESLPLGTHVRNLSNAALFVAGMLRGDAEAIGAGMRDYFATPVRSRNIPLFDKLRSAALGAGALGFAISGSGPACIALCDSTEIAGRELAGVLREVYDEHGLECTTYAGKPGKGCRITKNAKL